MSQCACGNSWGYGVGDYSLGHLLSGAARLPSSSVLVCVRFS